MKEFGIALAKGKLLVVCCEPVRDIMQVSPSELVCCVRQPAARTRAWRSVAPT